MTRPPTSYERGLADAVVILGMSPSEFRSLTPREWQIIIDRHNELNRK